MISPPNTRMEEIMRILMLFPGDLAYENYKHCYKIEARDDILRTIRNVMEN